MGMSRPSATGGRANRGCTCRDGFCGRQGARIVDAGGDAPQFRIGRQIDRRHERDSVEGSMRPSAPITPALCSLTEPGTMGLRRSRQGERQETCPTVGLLTCDSRSIRARAALRCGTSRARSLPCRFIPRWACSVRSQPQQFTAKGTSVNVYHYRGGTDHWGSTNGSRLLLIHFDGAAGPGDYLLRLDHTASSAGSSIHFDASLNAANFSGRFLNFVTPGSISDGATAFHNVAPNSYVIRTKWKDIDGVDRGLIGEGNVGELWTGSSVGPTVDGRVGVDVSAPGDSIVTTYAPRSAWGVSRWLLIEGGGGLYGMAGAVSAAAPIVTGIIALMLEVDPTLDALSVKKILQETARADEFTGPTPAA